MNNSEWLSQPKQEDKVSNGASIRVLNTFGVAQNISFHSSDHEDLAMGVADRLCSGIYILQKKSDGTSSTYRIVKR